MDLTKFKYIIYILFFAVIAVIIFSAPLQALELEVEESLEDFIANYRLSPLEIQELRDPFLDFRASEPEKPEEEEGEENEEEVDDDEISPPEFTVTGLLSRGEELVALIKTGDNVEILHPGQSYNDYVFSHKINDRVVFTKDGEQFELFARESGN